jgi:hypothetical protein
MMLAREALDALAVEGYRSRKLTQFTALSSG